MEEKNPAGFQRPSHKGMLHTVNTHLLQGLFGIAVLHLCAPCCLNGPC